MTEIEAQETECMKEYDGFVGIQYCFPEVFPTLCYRHCRKDKEAKHGKCVWGDILTRVKCFCDFCGEPDDDDDDQILTLKWYLNLPGMSY
ncbi:unnamed protein product [Cochlearia groenlandica]